MDLPLIKPIWVKILRISFITIALFIASYGTVYSAAPVSGWRANSSGKVNMPGTFSHCIFYDDVAQIQITWSRSLAGSTGKFWNCILASRETSSYIYLKQAPIYPMESILENVYRTDYDVLIKQDGSIVKDHAYLFTHFVQDELCSDLSYPDYSKQEKNEQCPYNSDSKSDGTPFVCTANPINIATGGKFQHETDYRSALPGNLTFQRYYNSRSEYVSNIGQGWSHSFSRYLIFDSSTAPTSIEVTRQDGRSYKFIQSGTEWISDPDVTDRLEATGAGWIYTGRDDVQEEYNSDGLLQLIRDRSGNTQTLTYNAQGRLEMVETNAGDSITIGYDADNKIANITDQSSHTWGYRYDSEGRLEYVDNPDGTSRQYHYEDSSFQQGLTGITDENGGRYATWSYDEQGRAISSEHAGGVDRAILAYNTDGTTTVTNPLGKQTTYHFTIIHGVKKVTQVEGHPTASCEGANQSYTYDANGFQLSKTDWNGNTTTYTHDARGLELSRTEAAGTPEERTITTEWHPQFRLPTKITEPNRITEYTYDTQGHQLSRSASSVQ